MRTWIAIPSLLLAAQLVLPSQAQDTVAFYRIVSPTTTVITALGPDGTMVWSNAAAIGTTGRIQRATTLAGPSNWVDYARHTVTGAMMALRLDDPNAPAGMALIPAGPFTMGNCMDTAEGRADELPLHLVHASAFYMDRYEVTKAKWDEVRTWGLTNGYTDLPAGSGKATNHPVHTVAWHEMLKWCNARSQSEGRSPCYTAGGTVYKVGYNSTPVCNWSATGYRLPTEAEWEKAARGGVDGHRFPWSDSDTIQHARANYTSYSAYSYDTSPTRGLHPSYNVGGPPGTSPAGSFAPNGYGLYDMAGNVWEFCWDWYDVYPSDSVNDPRGPASGVHRVFRGGVWSGNPFGCRVAYRFSIFPDGSGMGSLGFRACMTAGQ